MANGERSRTVSVLFSGPSPEDKWNEYQGNAYRCPVYLYPEDDGGFSVVAANLPGVASQGETEQESLANITEALAAAISTYKANGSKIPWTENLSEPESGAITRWILVHV